MKNLFFFLTLVFLASCSNKNLSDKVTLSSDIALDCILLSPTGSLPSDLYSIGEIISSDEYPPFTKKLTACGITLIARDEISNEFMRNVAITVSEMFTTTSNTDTELQQQLIENLYKYNTTIPLFYGENWDIPNSDEGNWDNTMAENSMCDIIMEDIPNQVMEVIEHILHHITNIGLHFTMVEDWGLNSNSELYRATNAAISSGNYDISQYSDISELDVRNRVILQEYAYWIIYTAWDLRKKYGPIESEWSIMTKEEFIRKEPTAFELFQNTIPKVLSCPSDSILNIF